MAKLSDLTTTEIRQRIKDLSEREGVGNALKQLHKAYAIAEDRENKSELACRIAGSFESGDGRERLERLTVEQLRQIVEWMGLET